MPTMLILFGLRFFFHSNDHEPFHIHVQSNDGEAKFSFKSGGIVILSNSGLKKKDLNLAMSIIEENKENFEREWAEFFINKGD